MEKKQCEPKALSRNIYIYFFAFLSLEVTQLKVFANPQHPCTSPCIKKNNETCKVTYPNYHKENVTSCCG